MTREEIIAKWAGLSTRERDAWVAEVVFGKRIGRERRLGGAVYEVGYGDVGIALDEYSADISAAWAVLEALNETHWISVMRIAGEVNTTGNYVAEIGEHSAGSNSAPEAICLAALIAKLTEASDDVAV
jgi:hypothetical protein